MADLMIGAYYLDPHAVSDEQIRDLADCGINLAVNVRNDRALLDRLAQHGVQAIVTGVVPAWFGGDGSNAGTMHTTNPLERYAQAAAHFRDHSAILGIDAGDEPSALDFPHYGQIIRRMRGAFPGKLPYLNLYPSYGLKGSNLQHEARRQLGADSYREYIAQYVQQVDTPYFCFDYYLYSADIAGLYESLTTVSQACRQASRDMWVVLQVNSHQPEVHISEGQLRFQAYCALAFGARAVIWACYCGGWWYNKALDPQGRRTQQYDKLRRVNRELHHIARTYMHYRHVDTHFVGAFPAEELAGTGKAALTSLDTACVRNLRAAGGKLLVGQMQPEAPRKGEALFILTADDPTGQTSTTHELRFDCSRPIRIVGAADNAPYIERQDGTYVLRLQTGQGVLMVVE